MISFHSFWMPRGHVERNNSFSWNLTDFTRRHLLNNNSWNIICKVDGCSTLLCCARINWLDSSAARQNDDDVHDLPDLPINWRFWLINEKSWIFEIFFYETWKPWSVTHTRIFRRTTSMIIFLSKTDESRVSSRVNERKEKKCCR